MVNCPSCGSNDVHHIEIEYCNGCGIVHGERTNKLDMDVVDFVKKLVCLSRKSEVYFALLEASAAQRYSDIRNHMRISSSSLSRALQRLLLDGLIRMVGKEYQAVSPPWMKEATRARAPEAEV